MHIIKRIAKPNNNLIHKMQHRYKLNRLINRRGLQQVHKILMLLYQLKTLARLLDNKLILLIKQTNNKQIYKIYPLICKRKA